MKIIGSTGIHQDVFSEEVQKQQQCQQTTNAELEKECEKEKTLNAIEFMIKGQVGKAEPA